MSAAGRRSSGDLLGSRPDVPSSLSDIYSGFYLLDRDGMSGRATLGSMRDLLDEMQVMSRLERVQIIRIWKGMDYAQSRVQRLEREQRSPQQQRRRRR